MLAHLRLIALTLLAALALALPASAAFETRARAAWVYDQTTGTVLLDKNADVPIPPASMSKLMTLNMLFEALRDGRVTLETQFNVSQRAKNMGGSTMFLDTTDRPKVADLIQGIIVQSGNDACVVVAENLAGTEEAFARLMTERAQALGLTASTFANATGWPDPNHRMSVHDLGRLAVRMIEHFPEYYGYFGEEEFAFDGRAPENHRNRNPILGRIEGADGLKTGHTEEAGYGLVGSAKQGNRRIVFVISGLASEAERAEEAERIANWAFRQFVERTIATAGTRIAEAEVWMGAERSVGLVPAEDVTLLLPAVVRGEVEAEVVYQGPVAAPIAAGQQLGELVISVEDMEPRRVPLVAETAVGRGGFLVRLRTAAEALFAQFAGEAASLQ
jgi:D-alanyl-D-alanine carboxypeptidase (penicillin-binding protein 5/6)